MPDTRTIETHASRVLLTGTLAYKFKKPVDFGFLDYSTLEKRRAACDKEFQLGRRAAPEIYLDVVEIDGEPAVKMREFAQDALLDRRLAAGLVRPEHVIQLARAVARMHASAERAPRESGHGSPAAVLAPVRQNFEQLGPLAPPEDREALARLALWSELQHAQLERLLASRPVDGFIRACHGDLHLGNVVWLDGRPVPFDGIEFNESFRWIDVVSDAAFLAMDLAYRGRDDLASMFLEEYFAATGDMRGRELVPAYMVYRAVVRAKVALMRLVQAPDDAGARVSYREHLALALRLAGGSDVVARELMERNVQTVPLDLTLEALDVFLREHAITGAPVVDGKSALVGVVSAADLNAAERTSGRQVVDVFTPWVVVASPETPAAELARLMFANRVHRIVIVEGDSVLGIVSSSDLTRANAAAGAR